MPGIETYGGGLPPDKKIEIKIPSDLSTEQRNIVNKVLEEGGSITKLILDETGLMRFHWRSKTGGDWGFEFDKTGKAIKSIEITPY